jgi:hypothetical protein
MMTVSGLSGTSEAAAADDADDTAVMRLKMASQILSSVAAQAG